METASKADEHSPTIAEILDTAHSGHPDFQNDHNDHQTCDQNPATQFPPEPGIPVKKTNDEYSIMTTVDS